MVFEKKKFSWRSLRLCEKTINSNNSVHRTLNWFRAKKRFNSQRDASKEILDRLESVEHSILTDIKELREMLEERHQHGDDA